MLTEELLKKFMEDGYVVSDILKFDREIKTYPGGLEALTNELNDLKNVTDNATFSYHEFEEGLTNYLKRIQSLVNMDPIVNFNDASLIDSFKNKFNDISNKYIITYKARYANEMAEAKKRELFNVKKSIHDLESNQELNDLDKTLLYSKYVTRHNILEREYRELSINAKKEKENIEFSRINDFNSLKTELFEDIKELKEAIRNLKLNSETDLAINEIFSEMNNYYGSYGINAIVAGKKFNDLLDKYGIKSSEKVNIEEVTDKKLIVEEKGESEKSNSIISKDEKESQRVIVPALGEEENEKLDPIIINKSNEKKEEIVQKTKTPVELIIREEYQNSTDMQKPVDGEYHFQSKDLVRPKDELVTKVEKLDKDTKEKIKISSTANLATSKKTNENVKNAAANSIINTPFHKYKNLESSFFDKLLSKLKSAFSDEGKVIDKNEKIVYQEEKQEMPTIDIDMDSINKVIDEIQEENNKKGKTL